jgi:hypothetical protein
MAFSHQHTYVLAWTESIASSSGRENVARDQTTEASADRFDFPAWFSYMDN